MAFINFLPVSGQSSSSWSQTRPLLCRKVLSNISAHNNQKPHILSMVASRPKISVLQRHLDQVEPDRQMFVARRSIVEISQTNDKVLTTAFILFICARGVRMTTPVEGWIRRAGERCEELGYADLGQFLKRSSKEESGHERLYIEDTNCLAARWNEMFPDAAVDSAKLVSSPELNPGEFDYIELHESVIRSNTPYRQIAIQSEIERLSITIVPKILDTVVRCLGEPAVNDLSFLTFHMLTDQKHSKDNDEQLAKLLESFPESVDEITMTSREALRAFGDYMDDCLVLAKALVASTS